MTAVTKPKEVTSVAELLRHLKDDRGDDQQPVWFRGHAVETWTLVPLIARTAMATSELMMMKRFKQNALLHVAQRPQSEWEWMFVAQHHGLPTRLLDWSESPLVALYFAVWDARPENNDAAGALWALRPLELNKSSNFVAAIGSDIPGFGDDSDLEPYLPTQLSKWTHQHSYKPLAAIALRNTPRIQSQHGVFTVVHKDASPLEGDDGKASYCAKYLVPADAKSAIREELKLLHVTKLALFPELGNVAEYVKGLT